MRFLLDMGLARSTAQHLRASIYVAAAMTHFIMRAGEVNRQLYELIARFAAELEQGALISVTNQGIRIRHLPAA